MLGQHLSSSRSTLSKLLDVLIAYDYVVLYMLFSCILELVQVFSGCRETRHSLSTYTGILSQDLCASSIESSWHVSINKNFHQQISWHSALYYRMCSWIHPTRPELTLLAVYAIEILSKNSAGPYSNSKTTKPGNRTNPITNSHTASQPTYRLLDTAFKDRLVNRLVQTHKLFRTTFTTKLIALPYLAYNRSKQYCYISRDNVQ